MIAVISSLFTVQGNGSSIWGESSGVYDITSVNINLLIPYEDDRFASTDVAHIQCFGPTTKWWQYTDRRIERDIAPYLQQWCKDHGWVLKHLTWSEQGMQPDEGWDFDVWLSKIE